jgi:hypothetical protein
VLAPDYRAAVLRLAEAERALAISDDTEEVDVAAATPHVGAAVDAGPSAPADPARSVEPMPGIVPAPAEAAPGTLLLADGFGSAAFGHLPAESPDSGHFQVEYRRGRYHVTKVDATWRGMPWVPIPGRYADAALVVDVYFPEGRPGGAAVLCCRAPAGPASGYHLHVAPAGGQFALLRWDGGQPTTLVDWSATPSLHPAGEANRLELRCAGTTLGVWLNGTLAATVDDETYNAGAMWLGADARDGGATTLVLAGLYVVQQ